MGEQNIQENNTKYEDVNFEEALGKLESIVRALETGTIPLDKSLESFENGIKLIRRCNFLLDDAERKVKILTRDENGEVVEADFETV